MSEKPEAWTAADSLIWPHLAAKLIREQHAENERLRELVRHILGDRITPEAYLLFGKAWVDEAHAALRREET